MTELYVDNVLDNDDFLTLFCSNKQDKELGESSNQVIIRKKEILDYKIYKDSQMVFSASNTNQSDFSLGKAVLGKVLLGDGGVVMGLSNNNTTCSKLKSEYTSLLIYIKKACYEKYNVSFIEMKLNLIYKLRGLDGFFIPYDSITKNLNIISSFLTFTDINANNSYYQSKLDELNKFEESLNSVEIEEERIEDYSTYIKRKELESNKIEPYNKFLSLPFNKDFKKYNSVEKLSKFSDNDMDKFFESNSKYINLKNSKKKKTIRGLNKYDTVLAEVVIGEIELTCRFRGMACRPNQEVFVFVEMCKNSKFKNNTLCIGTIKKLIPNKFTKKKVNSFNEKYEYSIPCDGYILFPTYYLKNESKEILLKNIEDFVNDSNNEIKNKLYSKNITDALLLMRDNDLSEILSTQAFCTFERNQTFDDFISSVNKDISALNSNIKNIKFTFLKKNKLKKDDLEKKVSNLKQQIHNLQNSKKIAPTLGNLVRNKKYYFILRKHILKYANDNPYQFYDDEVMGRETYNDLMKTIKEKIKNVMKDYCDYCVDSDIYPHPTDSSSRNELLFYNLDIPTYKSIKNISVKILFPQNIDKDVYEYGDRFLKPKIVDEIIHNDSIAYKLSKWLCLTLFINDVDIFFESPSYAWASYKEDGIYLKHGVNIISLMGCSIPIVLHCSGIDDSLNGSQKRNDSLNEFINRLEIRIKSNQEDLILMEEKNNTMYGYVTREEIIREKLKIQKLKILSEKLKKQIK